MDEYASFTEAYVNDISEQSGKRCYVTRDGGYITFYCEGTKLVTKHGYYDMNRYLNENFRDLIIAAKNSMPNKDRDPIKYAMIGIESPVITCKNEECGATVIIYAVLGGNSVLQQISSEFCPTCGTKQSDDEIEHD